MIVVGFAGMQAKLVIIVAFAADLGATQRIPKGQTQDICITHKTPIMINLFRDGCGVSGAVQRDAKNRMLPMIEVFRIGCACSVEVGFAPQQPPFAVKAVFVAGFAEACDPLQELSSFGISNDQLKHRTGAVKTPVQRAAGCELPADGLGFRLLLQLGNRFQQLPGNADQTAALCLEVQAGLLIFRGFDPLQNLLLMLRHVHRLGHRETSLRLDEHIVIQLNDNIFLHKCKGESGCLRFLQKEN